MITAQTRVAIGLMILRDNHLLLLRRANTGYADNMWALVGGKCDHGETPEQTAVREAYEEIGIQVEQKDLQFAHAMFKRDAPDASRDWMLLYFVIEHWTGEIVNKEPEKHSDVQWFPVDQLPHDFLVQHEHAFCAWNKKQGYSYFIEASCDV